MFKKISLKNTKKKIDQIFREKQRIGTLMEGEKWVKLEQLSKVELAG